MLKCEIKKITFIVTHLNPFSENARTKEIKKIIKNSENNNTIILGDLNSLSFLDKYDELKLQSELKKKNIKNLELIKFHTMSQIHLQKIIS